MDAGTDSARLHVACAHCGAVNRVPVVRLGEDPVCGKCGQALLAGKPIQLTEANFDAFTAQTELPVLIDFWAPWCGPCVAMAPEFERAALELKGKVIFAKVNGDENPALSERFGVRAIPTLLRVEGGKEVKRHAGAVPASKIVALFA